MEMLMFGECGSLVWCEDGKRLGSCKIGRIQIVVTLQPVTIINNISHSDMDTGWINPWVQLGMIKAAPQQ